MASFDIHHSSYMGGQMAVASRKTDCRRHRERQRGLTDENWRLDGISTIGLRAAVQYHTGRRQQLDTKQNLGVLEAVPVHTGQNRLKHEPRLKEEKEATAANKPSRQAETGGRS